LSPPDSHEARPSADCHPYLFLRAHWRGAKNEGRGPPPKRCRVGAPVARKGGKHHVMPCHHALAEALRAYIDAAGIAEERKGWLFRTSRGHDATVLSEQPMNQSDAWRMIRTRSRRRHSRADRQSHLPRDRHHRLSLQRRRARTRAGNGGAREPAHDQALRPHQGAALPGRGREDQVVILPDER
jgi:hypothetical protein